MHTALKYVHFILATAILDFWRTSTSRDTGSGTIKKFDPENIGIAVGILLLWALELEICVGVKYPPAAGKRRQKTAAGTRVKP